MGIGSYMEKHYEKLHVTASILTMIVCLVTAAGVLWSGGALANMVHNHDKRIEILEQQGSSALMAHIKMDDQRESDIKERVSKLETALAAYVAIASSLSGDVRSIGSRLEAMDQIMRQHVSQEKK